MENLQKLLNSFTPNLFISKRFWVAIIGGISMIVVAFRPELSESAPQLEASILVIVMVVINGYSQQDKASAEAGVNKYNGDGQQPSA